MHYASVFILFSLLLTATKQNSDGEYCDAETKICSERSTLDSEKFLFYDVNPPEGFNLRRDVYMRFATMLRQAQKRGKRKNWSLVLPPWYNLYHWRSPHISRKPVPWGSFFDIESLKSYAPVVEMHGVFARNPSKNLKIDRLYVLQNYEDAFEDGEFKDKWEITDEDCEYDGRYWGYNNISVKEIICVKYQGKISMLWELISQHPSDSTVMFSHGEIPLHDSYGTKEYWDCRKSMKFNKSLVKFARKYIQNNLKCNSKQCSSYISVHWRRQDFARSRKTDVPSVAGAVRQIDEFIKNNNGSIRKIYIATDASMIELESLENPLKKLGYTIYNYLPSINELDKFLDGGVAIIDQIICSRAAYFIGTHESTFTFRIQEEREILGFDSDSTFNRLCPDNGKCENPSKWTIVN